MSTTLPPAHISRTLSQEEAYVNRRRYQNGSIHDNGHTWIVRWREDEIRDGRRVRRQRQEQWTKEEYPTKPLAKRALVTRLAEINNINYRPRPVASFADFAKKWEEQVLKNLAPSTQVNYRTHIRVHLLPFFGPMLLRDISSEMVQQFVSSKGSSPKTVRNIIVTLQSMWKTARTWGYVGHDVTDGVVFPQTQHTQRFFFSVEEIRQILAAAEEPYKTFYGLAVETGLRAGELAAIRLEDIDLPAGLLRVRQSVWRGKVKSTKTRSSVRTVELSQQMSARLRLLVETWRPNAGSFLFATSAGTPWDPNMVLKRHLRPLLESLRIRAPHGAGFHSFRHTNATIMDSLNAPSRLRQSRLGHSSFSTTNDIYTHTMSEDGRRVAEELGEKIWGRENLIQTEISNARPN